MKFTHVVWNKVTGFSQIIAIVLFVLVFVLGFLLGKTYEFHAFQNAIHEFGQVSQSVPTPIKDVTYTCDAHKTVRAIYRAQQVELFLSGGRHLQVPQVVSGSGARYANADESFVFWNKGNTAFITEGKETTFVNCKTKPMPE